METIGQRVKLKRIARGLSGAALARLVGISGPSLWEIENCETKSVKASTLLGLVEHLHATADYILTGGDGRMGAELPAMESELIYSIRHLSPEKRVALLEYARYLVAQAPAQHAASAGTKPGVVTILKKKIGK